MTFLAPLQEQTVVSKRSRNIRQKPEDEECQKLVDYWNNGWPNKKTVLSTLKL